jgi:hypothetical protein
MWMSLKAFPNYWESYLTQVAALLDEMMTNAEERKSLKTDQKEEINGMITKKQHFDFFFGLKTCHRLFSTIEPSTAELQTNNLSANRGIFEVKKLISNLQKTRDNFGRVQLRQIEDVVENRAEAAKVYWQEYYISALDGLIENLNVRLTSDLLKTLVEFELIAVVDLRVGAPNLDFRSNGKTNQNAKRRANVRNYCLAGYVSMIKSIRLLDCIYDSSFLFLVPACCGACWWEHVG